MDSQQPVKLPSPTGGMVSSSLTSGTNGRGAAAAASPGRREHGGATVVRPR